MQIVILENIEKIYTFINIFLLYRIHIKPNQIITYIIAQANDALIGESQDKNIFEYKKSFNDTSIPEEFENLIKYNNLPTIPDRKKTVIAFIP